LLLRTLCSSFVNIYKLGIAKIDNNSELCKFLERKMFFARLVIGFCLEGTDFVSIFAENLSLLKLIES
jgi:hypothetical protein